MIPSNKSGRYAFAIMAIFFSTFLCADPMVELAVNSGCFICHSVDDKKDVELPLAPSYRAIALGERFDHQHCFQRGCSHTTEFCRYRQAKEAVGPHRRERFLRKTGGGIVFGSEFVGDQRYLFRQCHHVRLPIRVRIAGTGQGRGGREQAMGQRNILSVRTRTPAIFA